MIDISSKGFFFDSPAVQKAVDRETRKAMSRSLAFIRRRWRSSLRRRKKVSEPGQTPSIRSKDSFATLKNILFSYDQQTKSGIVGIVKANQVNDSSNGRVTVPSLMEHGGTVTIKEVQFTPSGEWYRLDRRRSRRRNSRYKYRTRQARYRPRPSGEPALMKEVESGNVASPWANVVKP